MGVYTSKRTEEVAAALFFRWGLSGRGSVYYDYDRGAEFPLFSPESTAYGDYCGCAYTQANQEALCEILDEIEEERGISIYEIRHEAYGTRTLFLYPRALAFGAVQEALSALDDYPSLDDSRASELEQEATSQAWEDWAREDFRRELQNLVPEDYGVEDTGETLADLDSLNPVDYGVHGELPWARVSDVDPEELLEGISDDDLDSLFFSACDASGNYPHEEGSGSSIYFPISEVVKSLEFEDLKDLL